VRYAALSGDRTVASDAGDSGELPSRLSATRDEICVFGQVISRDALTSLQPAASPRPSAPRPARAARLCPRCPESEAFCKAATAGDAWRMLT
jgi:hypothetical protein